MPYLRHNSIWITPPVVACMFALLQGLKLPAWEVGDHRFEPRSGIQVSKKQNVSFRLSRKIFNIVGSHCDKEVESTASDRQGSNFESSVWRAVLSHASYHPQKVLLAYLSLYVHKGGIKPLQFHLCSRSRSHF